MGSAVRPPIVRDAEERIPGCMEGRPALPTLALLRDHRDAYLKKQISWEILFSFQK